MLREILFLGKLGRYLYVNRGPEPNNSGEILLLNVTIKTCFPQNNNVWKQIPSRSCLCENFLPVKLLMKHILSERVLFPFVLQKLHLSYERKFYVSFFSKGPWAFLLPCVPLLWTEKGQSTIWLNHNCIKLYHYAHPPSSANPNLHSNMVYPWH